MAVHIASVFRQSPPQHPREKRMDFEYSDRSKALLEKLNKFMDEVIYPAEPVYEEQMAAAKDRWQLPKVIEECKAEAKKRGLWNMFLPADRESGYNHGTMGLSNLEYAPICEVLGRSSIASEATNCSAPDTGNMEVFARYGTKEHKEKWLKPLLNGEIRSCFAMTEPAVASSDARNVECRIESDGDDYVINGRKWWSSGMGDPRCKVIILMGKSDPNAPAYRQQSMIVVPRDAKAHVADMRMEIDMARLLVLKAAWAMDKFGNKEARQQIAMIKVAVPNITSKVVDRCLQLHGAGGVSQVFKLASMYAHQRTLRLADGPDEVHRDQVGRLEIAKYN